MNDECPDGIRAVGALIKFSTIRLDQGRFFMVRKSKLWLGLAGVVGLVGCQQAVAPRADGNADSRITATLTQLSETDRPLAEAQAFCAVQTHERLGSMGVPLKLDVQGQPVFVCCKGCEKKALADPEATLARVASLKSGK